MRNYSCNDRELTFSAAATWNLCLMYKDGIMTWEHALICDTHLFPVLSKPC